MAKIMSFGRNYENAPLLWSIAASICPIFAPNPNTTVGQDYWYMAQSRNKVSEHHVTPLVSNYLQNNKIRLKKDQKSWYSLSILWIFLSVISAHCPRIAYPRWPEYTPNWTKQCQNKGKTAEHSTHPHGNLATNQSRSSTYVGASIGSCGQSKGYYGSPLANCLHLRCRISGKRYLLWFKIANIVCLKLIRYG